MSNAFLDAFNASVAEIPVPQCTAIADPTGYGVDLSCTDDCPALFTEVSGVRVVAETAWRSITSDQGSIPDCTDETMDVRALLRRPATPTEVARWPVLIRNAILSGDDRIADVTVQTQQVERERWKLTILGTTRSGAAFQLVGELTASGTILKEILAK